MDKIKKTHEDEHSDEDYSCSDDDWHEMPYQMWNQPCMEKSCPYMNQCPYMTGMMPYGSMQMSREDEEDDLEDDLEDEDDTLRQRPRRRRGRRRRRPFYPYFFPFFPYSDDYNRPRPWMY